MSIAAQTEQAMEGRRRAAVPEPGDRVPGAIPTAFAELSDRNDVLEQALEQLAILVDDLGHRLVPVLPEVDINVPQPGDVGPVDPSPIDTRGQVARSLTAQARRVQTSTDKAMSLGRRVGSLIEGLEL